MFKITWDTETGGVLLSSKVSKDTLGISPRPVFFEELDLLELDQMGWTYPRGEEPVMWAVNKQYWYRGQMLFEAKGANIYDAPTVSLAPGIKPMALTAIDVAEMLRRNADLMFLLESEAIAFIRDTYVAYADVNKAHDAIKANQGIDFEALAAMVEKKNKQKMAVIKEDCDSFDVVPLDIAKKEGKRVLLSTRIDRFIASFSGGKDSQVVLDLVTRAIPPSEYEVIYSDTGYELPSSLDLYEDVKRYYGKRFPALKFSTTRNHESVLNYWDKIGTPSDTHRWCCSVMKTAPLYRSLKVDGNKQARVLAFEGVRMEESVRRSSYNRIGKGVKHSFVINARPIFDWNTTEVFMYLLLHDLPVNEAYRVGKPRVGCIFCPFGSPWDDMIVNRIYPKALKPFLSKIEFIVQERKIPNATEYIAERYWKLRSSGTNVGNRTLVQIKSSVNEFICVTTNGKKDILVWLPTIGDVKIKQTETCAEGYFTFEKQAYKFQIERTGNKATFKVQDGNNIKLRYMLRRIAHKAAYCINCEACEIECPTGALSVYPTINIDTTKCIHCHKCVDFHQHGCIVADSLVTTMGNLNSNSKISPYGTFGIQETWVDEFLRDPENFWEENSLGVKQVPSFKAWLRDAELIDTKNKLTSLGDFCSKKYTDYRDLVWEIIYINLCYNNALMNWFENEVDVNHSITREELECSIQEYYNGMFAKSSISYALQALLQVFKYSPIGSEFQIFEAQDSKNKSFQRNSYDNISLEGIVYSLFKYGEKKGVSMFRLSDLYNSEEQQGIYKEFGISKNELSKSLRALTVSTNRVLTAELNMGLDHITLVENLSPLQALIKVTE